MLFAPFRQRPLWIAFALAVTAMVSPAQPPTRPASVMRMPDAGPSPTPVAFIDPRPEDTVIATVSTGTLRISDLRPYAKTGGVQPLRQIPEARLAGAPATDLVAAAKFVAARLQAAADLTTSGSAEIEAQAMQEINQRTIQEIATRLFREKVSEKLTTPTLMEVKKYYDENLPTFLQPAYFKMHHLILYTYQPYIAKAGDTLENIAQEVAGDPAVAAAIRANVEQRPLRREAGKEFKPLTEGEELLVPMNNEAADKVRLRLESLIRQVGPNTKFEDLATTYSDAETKGAEIGPLPSGTRPLVPELMKYGFESEVGKLSPIFRTKHGWNVIQVTQRETTHTRSFDEVTTEIQATLRKQAQDRLTDGLLNDLMNQPDTEINYAALSQAASVSGISTDTVVYRAGKHQVKWAEIGRRVERGGLQASREAQREAIKAEREVVQANLLHYADLNNASAPLDVRERHAAMVTLARGNALMNRKLRDKVQANVTEEQVDKFYQEKQDQFKTPDMYKFQSIVMLIDPTEANDPAKREAALKRREGELASYLNRVKAPEDFVRYAEQLNAATLKAGENVPASQELVPLTGVPDELRAELGKLKLGQWSAPFRAGNRVMALLVNDFQAEKVQSLDEVRPRIRMQLMQRSNFEELMAQIESDLAQKARFEPQLK